MSKPKKRKEFAVLGLGHFGMRVAEILALDHGVNVLACDTDPQKVQHASVFATQAVQVDIENEDELEHLGLGNFDVVIISTGEEFEAALTAATMSKEKGSAYVIVKAETPRRKHILEKMGVDRVIFPEREMGEKVANSLMNVDIMDIFGDNGNFSVSEMPPMGYWIGKTVAASNIRTEHHAIILAIRRGYEMIAPVRADEIIQAEDVLIVWKEK